MKIEETDIGYCDFILNNILTNYFKEKNMFSLVYFPPIPYEIVTCWMKRASTFQMHFLQIVIYKVIAVVDWIKFKAKFSLFKGVHYTPNQKN